ncbi:GGDEF domain-containing protein [Geomesophilobacter sediminis]|uniref:diguanylate cyclase n=1 Tax=Geomesophilobacter sediminis TaxID=2798584 RepID=A0A8J7JJP0_9BACT|nr:HAMP domain-containing protein [Geomesophilobacter sediminis]MBJ6724665.1 HAMP domain-containing protein [Geomesophilobacter sediminis]
MDKNADPGRKPVPRFSIAQKLVLSYAAMAFFTLAALLLSLLGLFSLNRTARNIAQVDVPVIGNLIKLRAAVLAQEGYAGRYAILRSREFQGLFNERQKESLKLLQELKEKGLHNDGAYLEQLYRAYDGAADDLFSGKSSDAAKLRPLALRLIDAVDRVSNERQNRLQEKVAQAEGERRLTARGTVLISLSGFVLALLVAAVFIYRISRAIRKLQRATHRIAQGDFDFDPRIPPGDEVGDLAADFVAMAQRLKELERANLDASPLTRLPGNAAIERELEQRLQAGAPFAFCYADLDNFKPYGDHYGYSKGSDLIRVTGDTIYQETKRRVGDDGFVGHIGGDDFVMIVPEEGVEPMCQELLRTLDAEIARHYSPEDLAAGGIAGVDRYGVHRFFPIVSVSIAVVICGSGAFSTAVELARVTAELKDEVKEAAGSSYLIRRYPAQ